MLLILRFCIHLYLILITFYCDLKCTYNNNNDDNAIDCHSQQCSLMHPCHQWYVFSQCVCVTVDYTLWPLWVDTHISLPLSRNMYVYILQCFSIVLLLVSEIYSCMQCQ